MRPYLPGQDFETIIDSAIPEFARAEYPVFVDFLKLFLRSLEQERQFETKTVSSEYGTLVNNQVLTTTELGGSSYEIRKLLEYRDVATTLDDYIPHFYQMFAKHFPRRTFISPDLFVTTLRQLYTNKTVAETVAWFFRVLFNEYAAIYYPREDILKASDGTWIEEISIKVTAPINGYENEQLEEAYTGQIVQTVTGLAQVDRVRTTVVGQSYGQYLFVNELVLKRDSIKGEFLADQEVWNINSEPEIHTRTIPVITGVTVLSGGGDYLVGDLVTFSEGPGLGEGFGAAGVVTATSKAALSGVRVLNGGDGYVIGETVSFVSSTGENAEAYVDQIVYGNILLESEDAFLLTEKQPGGDRQYLAIEDHDWIPQNLSIIEFLTANGGVLPFNATDYTEANQATWTSETTMDYVFATIGSVPFLHPWVFGDFTGNTANVTLVNTMIVTMQSAHDSFFGNGDVVFGLTSALDTVTTGATAVANGYVLVSDIGTGLNRNRLYVTNTSVESATFALGQYVKSNAAVLQLGTATTSNTTANVTGNGTNFTVLAPYSHIRVAGEDLVVKSVTNSTFLTLWARPSLIANGAYPFSIVPTGTVLSITEQGQRAYGKIRHVSFVSPGSGYLTPPAVFADSISARAQAIYHYDP